MYAWAGKDLIHVTPNRIRYDGHGRAICGDRVDADELPHLIDHSSALPDAASLLSFRVTRHSPIPPSTPLVGYSVSTVAPPPSP